MAYSVIQVANSLLRVAKNTSLQALTPLQLQKLIYLAQGVALAASDGRKPLFNERIEAWQYGPVVQELYKEIKAYGSGPITEPISSTFDWFGPSLIPKSDTDSWDILQTVWESYGRLSAAQLVALTHRESLPEGYPWHEAWEERLGKEREGTVINPKVMTNKFKELVEAA